MAVANGAELVRALAKSGTGEAKLALCRRVLADVYQREHRTASAAEVVEALEAAEWVGDVTLKKARELAGLPRSAAEAARGPELPIEERLLGGTLPAADLDAGAAPKAADNPPADPAPPKPPGDDEPPRTAPEFVGPRKLAPPDARKR